MYKRFKRRDKRLAFDEYKRRSEAVKEKFQRGECTLEQFEREHEMLDDQYRFIR